MHEAAISVVVGNHHAHERHHELARETGFLKKAA
jgi:hypothetical protein